MYKYGILSIVIVVLLVGGYFLSSVFASATVKITPKQGRLAVSGVHQDDNVAISTSTALRFTASQKVEEIETMEVASAGVKEVSEKASGQIVISSKLEAPQQLVKTTRFEAPNGHIYRIDKDITVPAAAKDSAGKLIAGQLEVTVYADKPGEEYNLERAEFTIPGFKGGAKYALFSAKTKTSINGGFVGKAKTISESDKTTAREEMQKKLKAKINEKFASMPDNVILFNDAIIIDYVFETNADASESSSETITVKEKAIASAILFNRSEFGKYFAQGIPGYQGEDVDIANLSELNFELENKDGLNTDNLDTINFTLEGEAEIIWKFDNQKLIDDLQQADNKDYHSVFANYPEILKADIDFRPRWIKTVPTNPSKIIIEIAND